LALNVFISEYLSAATWAVSGIDGTKARDDSEALICRASPQGAASQQ
jgi:hypothetical protein